MPYANFIALYRFTLGGHVFEAATPGANRQARARSSTPPPSPRIVHTLRPQAFVPFVPAIRPRVVTRPRAVPASLEIA
ncbi:MAG TPA: hypothetical protein VGM56_14330 [Byssovorax sp.]